MGQPHKHAALIKAWADNPQLEFQFRGAGCQSNYWYDLSPTHPDWSASEIRIKPKTIKYRVALVGIGGDGIGTAVVDNESQADHLTKGTGAGLHTFGRFIKWLGDWQVVEV